MKRLPLEFRMALAAITTTAVGVAVVSSSANAQSATMKYTSSSASPAASVAPVSALSYAAGEVVKMFRGGVSRDLMVDYINASSLPYHLGADEISSLQKMGLPREIIQMMVQHDDHLREEQALQRYYQPPAPSAPGGAAPVQASAQGVTPPTPPIVILNGSEPLYYDDGSVVYDYADYGWPYAPPVIAGGWGWRHGYWGYRWGGGRFHGGQGSHGGFGAGRGGGGGGGHR